MLWGSRVRHLGWLGATHASRMHASHCWLSFKESCCCSLPVLCWCWSRRGNARLLDGRCILLLPPSVLQVLLLMGTARLVVGGCLLLPPNVLLLLLTGP